jgi:peptidoglycan/xylan/chitin deacetylase (PgdA/CDA1 family)
MRLFNQLNLFTLALFVSCSMSQKTGSRSVAKIASPNSVASAAQIDEVLDGITHSYILGQELLNEFDKGINTNPEGIMESDIYGELQAIRVTVDEYEEQFSDIEFKLKSITADSAYNNEEKSVAEDKLSILNEFISGNELPKNLQHLVMGNLRSKRSLSKKVDNYVVDQEILNKEMKKLARKESFKNFKLKVKSLGQKIKGQIKRNKQDRTTSSDTIFASTGGAGNITGRGFPANTWSLTYDDGPGGRTTTTVLQNLKDKNMKATFFMLARQVEALPSTAKAIADAGMDIASHSYDHPQLTKVGPQALEKQVGGSRKIIETKLGKPVKLFRLPYGAGVSVGTVRAKIAEHNMVHVFWNVDTLDWQDKNPTSIMNRAIKQMNAATNKGGIILFHDIHSQSVEASRMLMDYFIKEKINVCTVQAVVDQINQGKSSCQ